MAGSQGETIHSPRLPADRAGGVRLGETGSMSFLLRAALVIGALSYLAVLRQDGRAPDRAQPLPAGGIALEAMEHLTTGGIGALVDHLPPEARTRMTRAGTEALARHLSGQGPTPRPSADTLSESDRRPNWRGPTSP